MPHPRTHHRSGASSPVFLLPLFLHLAAAASPLPQSTLAVATPSKPVRDSAPAPTTTSIATPSKLVLDSAPVPTTTSIATPTSSSSTPAATSYVRATTGTIVLLVLGIVALLAFIIIISIYYIRWRRKRNAPTITIDPPPPPANGHGRYVSFAPHPHMEHISHQCILMPPRIPAKVSAMRWPGSPAESHFMSRWSGSSSASARIAPAPAHIAQVSEGMWAAEHRAEVASPGWTISEPGTPRMQQAGKGKRKERASRISQLSLGGVLAESPGWKSSESGLSPTWKPSETGLSPSWKPGSEPGLSPSWKPGSEPGLSPTWKPSKPGLSPTSDTPGAWKTSDGDLSPAWKPDSPGLSPTWKTSEPGTPVALSPLRKSDGSESPIEWPRASWGPSSSVL